MLGAFESKNKLNNLKKLKVIFVRKHFGSRIVGVISLFNCTDASDHVLCVVSFITLWKSTWSQAGNLLVKKFWMKNMVSGLKISN